MKNGLFILFLGAFSHLFAQNDVADKSLSPFFAVKGAAPNVDALPLKSTTADVKIAGNIADVTIKQVYENSGKTNLECLYIFPASTRAAVYAMQMKIGNRLINARIKERVKAREEYEKAKSEGKSASLLEQERPNVFQMNVANIRPNERVEVTLQYTEMIIPTEGVYQFVYPTVVGPRYANLQQEASKKPTATQPYLPKESKTPYIFDIKVQVNAPVPIQNLYSKTHWIDITKTDDYHIAANLKAEDGGRGNKDFVLNYALKSTEFKSGVMLYEHNDENFFMAMIQPPSKISNTQIPPREYIFIVDVSGSMEGFPLDVSKNLLKNLIGGLKKTDFFNVLLFAGGSSVLAEKSLAATPENIQKAIQLIDNQESNGGTEILPAIQRALSLPRSDKALSRSIVLVTDGYISVEKECFDLIRQNLDKSNVFSFGIGSSVNRYLIEGFAHVGQGEPFVVLNESEAAITAEKFRQYINTPVLTQVKYSFEGFDAYDIEPLTLPDVMSERPIILFGKYRGKPQGKIKIEGFAGKKLMTQTIDIGQNTADNNNKALRYLWAREKLRYLSDFAQAQESDELNKQVLDLGLKYNLLTSQTSFIAVDETPVFDANGNILTVKQGLPLPEGVEISAVGADIAFEEVFDFAKKGLPHWAFGLIGFSVIGLVFLAKKRFLGTNI